MLGTPASRFRDLLLCSPITWPGKSVATNSNWPILILQSALQSGEDWTPTEVYPALSLTSLFTQGAPVHGGTLGLRGKTNALWQGEEDESVGSPHVFLPAGGHLFLQRKHVAIDMRRHPVSYKSLAASHFWPTDGWALQGDTCVSRFSGAACYRGPSTKSTTAVLHAHWWTASGLHGSDQIQWRLTGGLLGLTCHAVCAHI